MRATFNTISSRDTECARADEAFQNVHTLGVEVGGFEKERISFI